ncbi:TPA: ISAs1 family transposase [Klebsiella oxytoca]|uniref:ISAs1 family transposase n=1 Tax=Klebsiella oxytoca TaxID=571 RepID=A0AAN5L5M7_KLEOX|nr:ISAs1 family transposase [Klebsiella oxytoca]
MASRQRFAGASLVLGLRTTAEKSNEKTVIPELLATLALEGCIVTIDAMGPQQNIAESIRERGADYVLVVKNNQPLLADSIHGFFTIFSHTPEKTPHTYEESNEKNHGRVEVRRCYAFNSQECLYKPERWSDLNSFAVVETLRESRGGSAIYISRLPADAEKIAGAVRAHWNVENRLHWCMDVVFADDQMRARSGYPRIMVNRDVYRQLTMSTASTSTHVPAVNRAAGMISPSDQKLSAKKPVTAAGRYTIAENSLFHIMFSLALFSRSTASRRLIPS